jgi:hypothetical protein
MTIQRALPDLAERINAEHAACLMAARDAISRAIEVGRLLDEVKGQIQYGQWARWVAENCSFGMRQAQNYMRVYHNRAEIEARMRNGDSHLDSLRGAVAALREPKANVGLKFDKVIEDDMGGFAVCLLDGTESVYLSGWRDETTNDPMQAASFDTQDQTYEYIEAWVEPGTLAKMSKEEGRIFRHRYYTKKENYAEAVRFTQQFTRRCGGGANVWLAYVEQCGGTAKL